uniref:TnpR protein n=1 Tax=Anaerobacillus isosaccharinicus TaxID=1532552 RepID=A0A1S2L558_9BACI
MKIKNVPENEEEVLFSWHANVITINRKKAVVFVNDQNRYVIALYGLKAKDFKKLDQLFLDAVKETFQAECIKNEIIEQFIQHSKQVVYGKTKNRTSVARMNRSCEDFQYQAQEFEQSSIIQSAVSKFASSFLVGNGNGEYIQPNEKMYEALEMFFEQPIFGCEAYELKVTLELEKYRVWRKVIVPSHFTFRNLHKIIQLVFGWQNYHLHDFYIYDDDRPILNLVCDEEAFAYSDKNDTPMLFDHEKRLNDYLPACKKVKYTYDFGDHWEHSIKVTKVYDAYSKNYPECIDGEGSTPPEDVGGEGGYEYFREILANTSHPEYENMLQWGRSQEYKEFDLNEVNRELKLNSDRL